MKNHVFYTAGCTQAIKFAAGEMAKKGCCFAEKPDTSVTHLLLGVPSFDADGTLKGGGRIEDILPLFDKNVTVVGGNLHTPALADYATIDLLQDAVYVAQNADITAHCAVKIALQQLPVTMNGCHVLILGWGRIGKCLAALLRKMGAVVTVAARKEADRAILSALGYGTEDILRLDYSLLRYRLIFNTVPTPVLGKEALCFCRPDCLKIDLASVKGMDGQDVIWARGLPGKQTPESSGALIAQTILRLCNQKGATL